MSLYAHGVSAANSVIGPYRARMNRLALGAANFQKGSKYFYARGSSGLRVAGVKSGIVNFLIDIVHILLLMGGVYLVMTSIFG